AMKRDILDLDKHVGKKIHVKFQGGRSVVGVLKGFDPLVNLVLDETVETIMDPEDPDTPTDETRHLGLTVVRGTSVMLVCPAEGMVETKTDPFQQQQEEAEA
ncbi:U6 snRNA-associated Sm-like protein LSm7, partial [Durusdinium trenchii]